MNWRIPVYSISDFDYQNGYIEDIFPAGTHYVDGSMRILDVSDKEMNFNTYVKNFTCVNEGGVDKLTI